MSWTIDKTIQCCYGHRVHTQQLNGEYANDLKCACRHLHGHEGTIQVYLTGDSLDHTGMITDFRHLEWLKRFVDTYIDHQFIIDRADPLYDRLVGNATPLVPVVVPGTDLVAGHNIDLGSFTPGPLFEMMEGILVVDFVPTSEHLSAWMGNIVQAKMSQLGVKVARIDWWETPKSRSTWHNS